MKKALLLTLALTMGIALSGCQKEEKEVKDLSINVSEKTVAGAEDEKEEKTVDVKALSESLLNEIDYTDSLTQVDMDTASMFLNFTDVEIEEGYIYESSGATAEEIVVLKCKDSDSAAKAKVAFEQRVSEQTENFADYVPEEVPKLKAAVIITSKEYAILSVSGDDSKAKDIIESAIAK